MQGLTLAARASGDEKPEIQTAIAVQISAPLHDAYVVGCGRRRISSPPARDTDAGEADHRRWRHLRRHRHAAATAAYRPVAHERTWRHHRAHAHGHRGNTASAAAEASVRTAGEAAVKAPALPATMPSTASTRPDTRRSRGAAIAFVTLPC